MPDRFLVVLDGRAVIGLVEDGDTDAAALTRVFGGRALVRVWTRGEELLSAVDGSSRAVQELDLLLIDLILPGIDGIAVASALRNLGLPVGHPPIVILTAAPSKLATNRRAAQTSVSIERKPDRLAELREFTDKMLAMAEVSGRGPARN